MISGHGNIETAVSAIKLGAYDFIEKPFKADRLVLVAERALEASRLKREVTDLRARAGATNRIVGNSPMLNQLRQVIERVAPTNSRVMITGAPGSGKELAARVIHETSPRAQGPFVAINAAAITPETMEVELFGVEAADWRGRKVGALEEAHGGTLYIDEVADMPRETQNRILRVLVDQNFQRVGGATRVHVDVRIISSTAQRPRGRDRGGQLPRGPVPPAFGGADPRALAVRAARGHSRTGRILHGPDFGGRPACRAGASARTPWPCCSPTTGRATSGNCATTSSG